MLRRAARRPCAARFSDSISPSRNRWGLSRPATCCLATFRWTLSKNLSSKVDSYLFAISFEPNPLMGTLTLQSNGPLYRNTVIGHWPLMGGLLHLVQRGGAWAGCGPAQSPHRCTKYNSPPINGQCTNYIKLLFDVAVPIKGLHDFRR